MTTEHRFEGTLRWEGQPDDTPLEYERFERLTRIEFAGGASLAASAPGVFHGDDTLPNPETLMMASLMQCHFLTFMAVATKSRIRVTGYSDRALGTLGMKDGKMRFISVALRPSVVFAEPIDAQKLAALHDKAHRNCFMSNSVNFPVSVEASVD